MIRAFVAIPVPETAAAALARTVAGLPAGRAVPAEQFHLTLAFLGERPEPVIEDAHYALSSLRAPGFWVRPDGLDIFQGGESPALVATVAAEPGLTHLQGKVAQAARSTGIALGGRRFRPHVTLARLGRLGPEDALAVEAFTARRMQIGVGPGAGDGTGARTAFRAYGFQLMRSTLGRRGPTYEVLADYPLGPEMPASPGAHAARD